MKSGERARVLPESGLALIAGAIARDPEGLLEHLAPVIVDLHARAGDPVKTLRALRKALGELIPHVIGEVVALGVGEVLDGMPLDQQVAFGKAVMRQARKGDAEGTLGFVRRWAGESTGISFRAFGTPQPEKEVPIASNS
jgi:hypothetical protein